MHRATKFLVAVLTLVFCFSLASCALLLPPTKEETSTIDTTPLVTVPQETTSQETTPEETTPEETTPEVTTPEVTTPEVTTPAVTEPDFSNLPDPDGTKRY